jgi:hypothetical protein
MREMEQRERDGSDQATGGATAAVGDSSLGATAAAGLLPVGGPTGERSAAAVGVAAGEG